MPESDLPETCDVAIVGGGPAGLAAAAALRARGVASVVVLEREAAAGGAPRHCGHYPFGMREFARVLRGPDYARRLVARAQAAGARIATGVTVTALAPGPRLALLTAHGAREMTARRVLLATGVRETSRAARLIGGTKPGGVLATGALQAMVYLEGLRPFARPVILGSELVAFSAILTCRHAGAAPVAMVEPGPAPLAGALPALFPRLIGLPLLLGTEVVAVHGRAQVEAVEVETAGARRLIAADGLIVSGRFTPEAALLRESHLARDPRTGGPVVDGFGRCSDPAFFAAGNLLRAVETAGWSWAEGVAAGRAVAESLAGRLPDAADATPVGLRGEALSYVVPQRIAPGAPGGTLQLRVARAARGRLSLRVGARTVWSRRVTLAPERRILVPLDRWPAAAAGPAEVTLEEAAP